jgi:hypothetical protein
MSKGLQISDYKVALHLHTTENIGRRIVDPMSFNVCLASPITAYIVKFSKDASQSKIRVPKVNILHTMNIETVQMNRRWGLHLLGESVDVQFYGLV